MGFVLYSWFPQLVNIKLDTQNLSSEFRDMIAYEVDQNKILIKRTWHPLVVKHKSVSQTITFSSSCSPPPRLWLWARKILQYTKGTVHPQEKRFKKKENIITTLEQKLNISAELFSECCIHIVVPFKYILCRQGSLYLSLTRVNT